MFGFKKKNQNGSFSPVSRRCSVCGSTFSMTSIEMRFYSGAGVTHEKCRSCRLKSPFDNFEEATPQVVNSNK